MDKKELQARTAALQKIQFSCAADGILWIIQAATLKKSSEVLFKKASKKTSSAFKYPKQNRLSKLVALAPTPHQMSGFLLLGLAIENMAKAVLIAQDPGLVSDGKLNKNLCTHNSEALIARIDQQFRPRGYSVVLRKLQAHVEWLSKYPIPKTPSKMLGGLAPSDIGSIDKLYAELLVAYLKTVDEF